MGMIINPYLVQPSNAYGTLTTAWIAATGETDLTILGALNTLESDLTTYGLTSKIKALYPFVGGSSTKHSYNFINTAQYQITWYGGVTHTSNGVETNGITGYGDLSIGPTNTSQNNASLGVYCRTEGTLTGWDIGNTTSSYTMISAKNASTFYGAINSTGFGSTSNSSAKGFFIASRLASGSDKGYKNGSLVFTSSNSSAALESGPFFLGGLYRQGTTPPFLPVDRQYALAYVGDGLTDTEAANFYTAVQAFQTTLSRNV